ncbi:hypothetical protein C9994_13390 [Marivirga lumbricoides]|uniref:Leucine-rich repeat domain-containing protein n=1 Tax=Marivirga lumbricoides TaxID=1046115 RepID=A0A2T4DGW6_9BACT|nr:hypothetical protein C9994_13390 [Marivirga lumbricoides]
MNIYKYIISGFLLLLISSCNERKEISAFKIDPYISEKEAKVILNEQGYDKIPEEVGTLGNITKLTISEDANLWSVFPPLEDWDRMIDNAPKNKLTPAIAKLKSLEYLGLGVLNLTELPDEFVELKQLDSLNLTLNFLIIANEIDKLKKLKNLSYINITGNRIDTTQILQWQKENPNLEIIYKFNYAE